MNRGKYLLLFIISLLSLDCFSQVTFPTSREVYNFSVGDTFIYEIYDGGCAPQSSYQCTHDYWVTVTSKSYSPDSATVYYSYNHGGYSTSFSLPDSFPNLDSAVILPPYPTYLTNKIDTAYIDTLHYCIPTFIALTENRYGLSDFFNTTFAVGLGKVTDYYFHDQGSSPYGDFSLSLVYYHKGNLICGSYDSTKLVSSLSEVGRDQDFSIYPNPCSDKLMIVGPATKWTYHIYDALGSACKNGDASPMVSVGDLPTGAYLLKLETSSRIVLLRFCKE
ncbi:MAG: T9SS type A sorting domain-containing protein [Bacteroidetes bacterium]|nr:T9SS type A sorting domain-containing protein [Bacteroidota bacterium]